MQVEAIYTPTIMDGPVVRFQFGFDRGKYREIFSGQERTDWSAEINASRNGVSMSGGCPTYNDEACIAKICELYKLAWSIYVRMRDAADAHAVAKEAVDRFNADRAQP